MDLNVPIETSCNEMSTLVQNLQESGATALGPALLISIGICSKKKGSALILCTDGIANVGLGMFCR